MVSKRKMKLSPLISRGCVLQRNQENMIRGCAGPGNKIMLKLQKEGRGVEPDAVVWGKADETGSFVLHLPPMPAGCDYCLFLTEYKGAQEVPFSVLEVEDVAFGDVFLLSGQSNMALPVLRTLDATWELVEQADYPQIREFVVPMAPTFGKELTELSEGTWKKARKDAALSFGAAGFFMACELHRKYKVPIGLIQTAIGGTPIASWCSERTIRELSEHTAEMEQCYDAAWIERVQAEELEREQMWHKRAWEPCDGTEGIISIPGLWRDTILSDFHGSLVLEKEFYLEDFRAEETDAGNGTGGISAGKSKAMAYIGAIVDADRIYINDCLIGETGYCYPPRRYDFSTKILRPGKNHIRIEMMVFRDTGGFIPDKPYYIRSGNKECSLEGEWKYRIVRRMEELPQTTFFQYKPAALYNGMLCPLRGISVKGMAFYQGESDGNKAKGYAAYFDRALKDWRKMFGNPKLPVVYVQLAGFGDSKNPCPDREWAFLREEQRKSLHNEETAMVTALDLGEYNDLHPQRKDELGRRIALCMEALAYGENVEYSGPVCVKMEREGEGAVLTFTHAAGGLQNCTRERGCTEGYFGDYSAARKRPDSIFEVELAGEDQVFYEAEAVIEGNRLKVYAPDAKHPCYCRYAWKNFPGKANLYNSEGLAAAPFVIGCERQ